MFSPHPECLLVEVFPRDGLQTFVHEKGWHVPTTDEKVQIIEALVDAGVSEIEVTGFVHPKVIPPLADAAELVARLGRREGVMFKALVPNLKGAQRAIEAKVQKITCMLVVSQTYQRLNANMSVEENACQIETIIAHSQEQGVDVEVAMGTCTYCPYEGEIAEDRVLGLIERWVRAGVDEVTISDSIGMADPLFIARRIRRILTEWPHLKLGLHVHDMSGMALANIFAAWEAGVRKFDTSVCGLGGGIAMPIPVVEMGNVSTEDVTYMFNSMGIETGIDMNRLLEAAKLTERIIGQSGRSRIVRNGTLEQLLAKGQAQLAKGLGRPGDSTVGASGWKKN